MLAVVVADIEVEGEYQLARRPFGATPQQLRSLAEWLIEREVEEAVMESTAQYWKPVWAALEQYWKPRCQKREGAGPMSGALHLAQAQSNRGPRGRKKDFPDAEQLLKRLVAQELRLSFVPDAEQRLWRTVTRRKYQLTRNRARLQNQLESLLEEAHIKLSSLVSDLLGASARRMLHALADGETNPATLAALANKQLRATSEQLCDALGACTEPNPVYRRLLKMALDELQFIEHHIGRLDQEMATLLLRHQDAVQRLAEVPGLGVDSAQQIIAEVGATAASFPSEKHLSSWVGACPGDEESAGVSHSHRSPNGNRQMRRILNRCANAAVKVKGSIFQILYRRLVPPLGTQSNHRGNCASDLSTHLGYVASRRALCGTRPCRPRKLETSTHGENDPATPELRLSRRTASTESSMSREEFSTLHGVQTKEQRTFVRCPSACTLPQVLRQTELCC
jgi:transposase